MNEVVRLEGTSPLSRKLRLDMTPYCQACHDDYVTKRWLDSAIENLAKDPFDPILIAEWERANERHLKANARLTELRALIEDEGRGITGALQWTLLKEDFKNLINEQLDNKKIEKNKGHQLLHAFSHTSRAPIALQCLDEYFVEFLKNSMDAIVKKFFQNPIGPAILEMEVSLAIAGANISVTVTDNGGGFPAEYLKNFDAFVGLKAYRVNNTAPSTAKKLESSKFNSKNYYFGGAGLGIPLLCSFLLDGECNDHDGLKKHYDIKPNETSIQIANTLDGAQITLVSPIKSYSRFVEKENKQEKTKESILLKNPFMSEDMLEHSLIKRRRLKKALAETPLNNNLFIKNCFFNSTPITSQMKLEPKMFIQP